jgi:hypothetical protein
MRGVPPGEATEYRNTFKYFGRVVAKRGSPTFGCGLPGVRVVGNAESFKQKLNLRLDGFKVAMKPFRRLGVVTARHHEFT